jgi:hypothetical protein
VTVNGHTHTLFFQDGSSTQQQRPAERALAEKREPSTPAQAARGGPIDDDPLPL